MTHYGTRQVIIFALWWGLCVPPYLTVLFLFYHRRTRHPIKARSPLLLICSAMSGFILLGYMASRNLFDKQIPCPTTYYLGVFLFVLYIVPYLLRCYRLMGIFDLSVAKATLFPDILSTPGNSQHSLSISTSSSPLNPSSPPTPSSSPPSLTPIAGLLTTESGVTTATTPTPQPTPPPTPTASKIMASLMPQWQLSGSANNANNWQYQDIIKKREIYSEHRLLRVVLALMVGLTILLAIIHGSLSGKYLKANTHNCEVTERFVLLGLIVVLMVLVFVFIFLIYKMRHVTDAFSINNELKMVCVVAFVHVVLALWLQSANEDSWPSQPYVGYVTASLVLFCYGISVIWPLVLSFSRKRKTRESFNFRLTMLPDRTSTGSVVQAQFVTFLQDPVSRKWFQKFLISEFSVETVLFWADVQEFKTLTTQEDLARVAAVIYEKYIIDGAPLQVNLSHESIVHTQQALNEELDLHVFDEPEEETVILMKGDAYPRFQHSPYCADMVKELKQLQLDDRIKRAADQLMS